MTLRVIVDSDVCIGSANCLHLAPGGFVLDTEGVAIPAEPLTATDDQLRLAERSCPTGAISIEETPSEDQTNGED